MGVFACGVGAVHELLFLSNAQVAFGVVGDENRGDQPFKKPIFRDDPWFWLRDDSRTDKKILVTL